MKKFWLIASFLGFIHLTSAKPLLLESYQEDRITIPPSERETLTVVAISFSVDSSAYAQFATGGIVTISNMWLELDGEKLPPTLKAPLSYTFSNITYTYSLEPGSHDISFKMYGGIDNSRSSTCEDAYLQALIFLPDTSTNAVAEQPTGDAEPLPSTPSLISQGPYVNVQGATELVDSSGRVIEDAIEDDKVYITNLPTGTYFARDGDNTIVKIVKVE